MTNAAGTTQAADGTKASAIAPHGYCVILAVIGRHISGCRQTNIHGRVSS